MNTTDQAGAAAAELRGSLELLELLVHGASDQQRLLIRFGRACVLHVLAKLDGDAGREAAALDTLETLGARLRCDTRLAALAERWTGDGARRDPAAARALLVQVFAAVRHAAAGGPAR